MLEAKLSSEVWKGQGITAEESTWVILVVSTIRPQIQEAIPCETNLICTLPRKCRQQTQHAVECEADVCVRDVRMPGNACLRINKYWLINIK